MNRFFSLLGGLRNWNDLLCFAGVEVDVAAMGEGDFGRRGAAGGDPFSGEGDFGGRGGGDGDLSMIGDRPGVNRGGK